MHPRLRDLPRFSSDHVQMPATRYNQVRLGLLRLENPLRFCIPGLRNLSIVLDDDSWVCVDESLDDIPILAWVTSMWLIEIIFIIL